MLRYATSRIASMVCSSMATKQLHKLPSLKKFPTMMPIRMWSIKSDISKKKGKKEPEEVEVEGPHGVPTTEKEFNEYMVAYFDRCDIDGWELRQGMNNILGMDLIVEPVIIVAALHACRRNNDIALAIRWLEGCKEKCAGDMKVAYPYIMKEIKPTLQELGVPTLEELRYDVPELALASVFDM